MRMRGLEPPRVRRRLAAFGPKWQQVSSHHRNFTRREGLGLVIRPRSPTFGYGLGTAQDARSLIRAASYLMEPEPFTWLTATLLRRVRGAARAPCLDSSR